MMNNIFIDVRDYFYIWLMNDYGELHAKRENRFRIGGFWALHYTGIFLCFVWLIPESISNIIFSPKASFLKMSVGGIISYIPYFLWLKWYLFPMLDKKPIDLDLEKSSLSYKKWVTIFVFIGGFVFILLVGLISNLVRFGHV